MSNGDLNGCHPQHPIWVEVINTTGCCPVPRSPRHNASHLGLGGLVLLRIEHSRASKTKSAPSGGRGVFQMVNGSATLADNTVATRENRANKSPLGMVLSHPSFPPLHMGWLNLEPEGLKHLIGTLGRQLK
jgi:hypothetical protein